MLKILLGIISVIGFIAYGMTAVSMSGSHLFETAEFRAAFVGLIAGTGLWLVLGRKLSFFSVFEHEMTHLIFSLLMFQRPRSFYASDKRGHVSCERGTFVDELAPYYFPTFSYILLALYPALKPSAYTYFYPVLGFLTGYHIVSNVAEFRPGQSDIRRHGFLFSTIFCAFASILTLGFLLAFVVDGFGGGVEFISAGLGQGFAMILQIARLGRYLPSYLIGLV